MQIEITAEYLASQGLSKTFPVRFWKKVDKNGPMPDPIKYPLLKTNCWRWTGCLDWKGYGFMSRWPNGVIKSHRASWILHKGPIPIGCWICHHCDFPACVQPRHLFLGDSLKNVLDAIRKERHAHGDQHGMAILNMELVKEIRRVWIEHRPTITVMAKIFGQPVGRLRNVLYHDIWKE